MKAGRRRGLPCLKDAGHIRLESTMNSYPELASFPAFFDEHVRKAGLNAEQMGALNWLGVLLMVHQRHRIMLRDVDLYRCEPGGDAGYASVPLPLDIYSWQRQNRRVPAERTGNTLYVADSCVSMEDDNGAEQFWNVRLPSDWVTFLPRDVVTMCQAYSVHVFFIGARHPGNVSIFQAKIGISRQYGDGFDR